MDPSKQLEVDNKMIDLDGTDNKVRRMKLPPQGLPLGLEGCQVQ